MTIFIRRRRSISALTRLVLTVMLGVVILTPKVQAQVLEQLHSFSVTSLGPTRPTDSLVLATDGAFYGTTANGGSNVNEGVAYKITTDGTFTILHVFGDGTVAHDGIAPYGGLVQGTDGYFYGTTVGGGTQGHGTIFRMTSTGTILIMHSFGAGTANDGYTPFSGLIQAHDGKLYGMTSDQSQSGGGTAFSITPGGTYTILHRFGLALDDGAYPLGTLCQASDGYFYGQTAQGGANGDGTLFRMTSTGTVTVLHHWGDFFHDGLGPAAGVTEGADGWLYGTTVGGGQSLQGTLFKCTKTGDHCVILAGRFINSDSPHARPIFGPNGNIFFSGNSVGFYEFDKSGVQVAGCGLGNFDSNAGGALVVGPDGYFYGTTQTGGTNGQGSIFRVKFAPRHFLLTSATTVEQGQPLDVNIAAYDDFNIPQGYDTNPVHLFCNDPTATLPADGPLTQGQGSFNVIFNKPGTYKVTAYDATDPSVNGTTASITVTPKPAYLLVTAPAHAVVGQLFSFTVSARYANGAQASLYQDNVVFTTNCPASILPGSNKLTNGQRVFNAILNHAGSFKISAFGVSGNIRSGTSASINVAAPSAVRFRIVVPASVQANVPANATLTALNASGNPTTSYSGTIHVTSNDPNAVLPGDITVSNGTRTFSITFNTGGSHKVAATDSITGISGASNNTVVLAATHLLTIAPAHVTKGTPFTFTVEAIDQYGKVAPGYSAAVKFGSNDPPAVLPASSGLTNGVGTFTATLNTLGSFKITSYDTHDSLAPGTSAGIQVDP